VSSGIAAADPATFVFVIGGVLLVTGIASLIPARKIAKLDPSRTLRHK
jgi:ABC-type lipoprotein release transport system permease subunit